MSAPKNGKQISNVENLGSVLVPKPHYRSSVKEEGVCFGMTVLWIRGLIQSGQIEYNYSNFEAELMHNKYTIFGQGKVRGDKAFWESRKKVFKDLNLKMNESGNNYYFGTCKDAFKWIKTKPLTVFSIKVPGHAIAAYYQRPNVYYFDPNHGVYEYTNINDFCFEGYMHAFFNYCDWQAKPEKSEVFILPIESI